MLDLESARDIQSIVIASRVFRFHQLEKLDFWRRRMFLLNPSFSIDTWAVESSHNIRVEDVPSFIAKYRKSRKVTEAAELHLINDPRFLEKTSKFHDIVVQLVPIFVKWCRYNFRKRAGIVEGIKLFEHLNSNWRSARICGKALQFLENGPENPAKIEKGRKAWVKIATGLECPVESESGLELLEEIESSLELPGEIESGLTYPEKLSHTENLRIMRAFYRWQLFCNLFRKRRTVTVGDHFRAMGDDGETLAFPSPPSPGIPLINPLRSLDFLLTYESWEIEVILCIHQFGDAKYAQIFHNVLNEEGDVMKYPRFHSQSKDGDVDECYCGGKYNIHGFAGVWGK
jgi:hypothetical protein